MELPHLCCEHCVWARMWHHPVFWNHQGSLSLPLCGKLEGLCGYWTMILSASSWNYFIALCLVWTFSSASSRSGPSTQSLSGESCSSTHTFFWLQHTLFDSSGSRPPNYKGTASSMWGIACRSPDGSMLQGAWTVRAHAACSFNYFHSTSVLRVLRVYSSVPIV